MKKIFIALKDYTKSIPPHALLAFVLLHAISIGLVYQLVDDVHFRNQNTWGYISCCALYFIPSLPVLIFILFQQKSYDVQTPRYLCLYIITILFLGLNRHYIFIQSFQIPREVWTWAFQCAYNLQASLFYFGVPLAFAFFVKTKRPLTAYGFQSKSFDYKPYALMLLFMLPLLLWAAPQESFQEAYPRYKPSTAEVFLGFPSWLTVGLFELTYFLQFAGLEFFLRGFLVLALFPWIGRYSVLLMVSIYTAMHFSKPMGECIGSFFGGYILGVISLKTKSIFGGIWVHVGIAFLMEFLAMIWQR